MADILDDGGYRRDMLISIRQGTDKRTDHNGRAID